jgi:hypothetical protein
MENYFHLFSNIYIKLTFSTGQHQLLKTVFEYATAFLTPDQIGNHERRTANRILEDVGSIPVLIV